MDAGPPAESNDSKDAASIVERRLNFRSLVKAFHAA